VQRARFVGFGGRTLEGTGVVHVDLTVGAALVNLGVSPDRSHRWKRLFIEDLSKRHLGLALLSINT
jgi:hypothetical protein